jgi:hypothetical protein
LFAEEETGKWIQATKVSFVLILDIMHSILKYHEIIAQYSEFTDAINHHISPLILSNLKMSNPYPVIIRLHAISNLLLQFYPNFIKNDIPNFLTIHHKLIENTSIPTWRRVLCMEVFRNICKSNDLIILLDDKMFDCITTSIKNIVMNHFSEKNNQKLEFTYKPYQNNRLDNSINLTEPFQTGNIECISNCIDIISSLIKSTSNIINVSTKSIYLNSPDDEKDKKKGDLLNIICKDGIYLFNLVLSMIWGPIYPTLNELLDKSDDEVTIHNILELYLLITIISGKTKLSTPRDAFLTSLFKYVHL